MHSLLVVVPYRDREPHLKFFVPSITKTLKNQKIKYELIIVEQSPGKLFNRGLLCNIGFVLYHKNHDYVIFHDVDMVCPKIDYSYNNVPTSLIRKRTKQDAIYKKYFGGVTLFPTKDFLKINGFSNDYWGWGAEDDELRLRCNLNNIHIATRNGFCIDLELTKDSVNRKNNPNYKKNLEKFQTARRYKQVGNSGICNINKYFTILDIKQKDNFTIVKTKI